MAAERGDVDQRLAEAGALRVLPAPVQPGGSRHRAGAHSPVSAEGVGSGGVEPVGGRLSSGQIQAGRAQGYGNPVGGGMGVPAVLLRRYRGQHAGDAAGGERGAGKIAGAGGTAVGARAAGHHLCNRRSADGGTPGQ